MIILRTKVDKQEEIKGMSEKNIFDMTRKIDFLVYEPLDGHDKYSDQRRLICKIHYKLDINGEKLELEPLVNIDKLPHLFWFARNVVERYPESLDEGRHQIENACDLFLHSRVPPPNRMFLLETFEKMV